MTINSLVSHPPTGLRFLTCSFAETIVAILNAGRESDRWPAFRTEEFDNVLARSLQHIRIAIPFSNNADMQTGIIDCFSWTVLNTKSVTMKREMFKCLDCIISSHSDASFIPLISVLMPFLGDVEVQDELASLFGNVFSMIIPPPIDGIVQRKRHITNDESDRNNARNSSPRVESFRKKRKTGDGKSVGVSENDTNEESADDASHSSRKETTERIRSQEDFIGTEMIERISGETEEIQTVFLVLVEHIKAAISNATQEHEIDDARTSHCSKVLHCIRILHLFMRSCANAGASQFISSLISATMSVCTNIAQANLITDNISGNSATQVYTEEVKREMFDVLIDAAEWNTLGIPMPKAVIEYSLQLFTREMTTQDPSQCAKKAFKLLSILPQSEHRAHFKNILEHQLQASNYARIILVLEYLPIFLAQTIPSDSNSVMHKVLTKLKELAKNETVMDNDVHYRMAQCVHEILRHISRNKEKMYDFHFAEWEPLLKLLKSKNQLVQREMLHALSLMIQLSDEDSLRVNARTLRNHIAETINGVDDSIRRLAAHNLFTILAHDNAKQLTILFETQDADQLFQKIVNLWNHFTQPFDIHDSPTKTDLAEVKNRRLEALVIALGSVGRGAQGRLLLLCIYKLLEALVSDTWIISGCAYDALRQISRAHNKDFVGNIIEEQFHHEFYNHWLCEKLEDADNTGLITAVGQVAFDCGSVANFMSRVLPTILPQLIIDRRRKTIDRLSELMNPSNRDATGLQILGNESLLTELFLRSDSIADARKHINFLVEWINGMDVSNLDEHFKTIFDGIVDNCLRDLVWRLGSDQKDERESASRVLCNIHEIKTPQFKFDNVSGMMRLKIVGIMEYVIHRMRVAPDQDVRRHALRSLNGLMTLPGVIAKCRTKLMQCLTLAMKEYPDLISDICQSCQLYFIQLIKDDTEDSQHWCDDLFQLVAELLDFIHSAPDEVATFIEWAVCEQFEQDHELLAQMLPTLPDIPQLAKVHSILQIESEPFAKISRLISSITSGNYARRKTSLKELRDVIRGNIIVIQKSIMESDSFQPLISDLVDVLLQCMAGADDSLRILVAECLGSLGAIEPSRLKILSQFDSREELGDLDLALTILRDYLRPHIVIANYGAQNSMMTAGYAVQGLLRFCIDCESPSHNATKAMSEQMLLKEIASKEWWNTFEEDMRETLEGYLTSKYIAKEKSDTRKMPSAPMYRSGQDARRWLTEWTRYMIKKSTGSRAVLFQFCRGIMRDDISIMLFLLPYIVLHVITCGKDEDRADIVKEISAVLNATKNEVLLLLDEQQATSQNHATNTSSSCASAVDAESGEDVLLPLMDSHKQNHSTFEHCQQIFSLLDVLNKWRSQRMVELDLAMKEAEKRQKDKKSRRSRGDEHRIAMAKSFVNNMDSVLLEVKYIMLSFAAFTSGAYERALKYYENHLTEEAIIVDARGKVTRNFKSHQLAFLQNLYSKLEEPDGLVGIASFRTTTSLQEQIIDHEAEGNWSEALNCYELAIDQSIMQNVSIGAFQKQQRRSQILSYQLNILKCLRNLGNLRVMDENVQGMLSRYSFEEQGHDPDTVSKIVSYGVQAAWRLGNWDRVQQCLDTIDCDTHDFEVSLARTLLLYKAREKEAFVKQLELTRRQLIGPLSASCKESYDRSYPLIVNLQILEELERSFELLSRSESDTMISEQVTQLLEQFRNSLTLTTSSMAVREPILSLRKQLFTMHSSGESEISNELGRNILSWAKLARKSQQLQTASSAILQLQNNASLQKPANFFLESAKLQWQKGNKQQAIVIIDAGQDAIDNRGPSTTLFTQHSTKNSHYVTYIKTKMKLLSVLWNEQLKQKRPEDVQSGYDEVIDELPHWEDGYFHLARYLDSLYCDERQQLELRGGRLPRLTDVLNGLEDQSASSVSSSSSSSSRSRSSSRRSTGKQSSLKNTRRSHTSDSQADPLDPLSLQAMIELEKKSLTNILQNYGASLKYGVKHMFQSLPRMLTVWFNTFLELKFLHENDSTPANIKQGIARLQKDLDDTIANLQLPPYEWYTVLTQLVSRLGYGNETLVGIVADIFSAYPQQTIWRLSTALFTKAAGRRGEERKSDAEKIIRLGNRNNITGAINDEYKTVITGLMELADIDQKGSPPNKLRFSKVGGALRRHIHKSFILPLQRTLNVASLPQQPKTQALHALSHEHNPFIEPVQISQFEEEITVMSSLAKPKRVTIVGNDGNRYGFLCKPRDDLRKDSRLMEYQQTINKLLKSDPESRKRNLHIRTYAVVPLNEDTGMVEWVNDTEVMRSLIFNGDINSIQKRHEKLFKKKRPNTGPVPEVYLQELPLHSLMFHKWFLKQFPEPAQWFQSRLNYTRSLAVLSMSSFIVGLGDRHTENFLLDSVTGEVVQIDLAMLFEQARFLTVPEQVPFRLTRNLVDGMGVTGYEGVFRRVCEISMRVLRDNKDTLLNVLESFVHDPLLDWNKSENRQRNAVSSVRQEYNSYGSEVHINVIKSKLSGCVADSSAIGTIGLKRAYEESVPLGVQGQVNTLINQATSDENLSKMFVWWMAFL